METWCVATDSSLARVPDGNSGLPAVTPGVPSAAAHTIGRVPEVRDLISHSDELLERERAGLVEGILALSQRIELHRGVLEELELELATKQRLLREVDELTDRRPQLRLERLDRQLRGRRLQEVAVELLRRRSQEVIHYREWFGLVRAEGWEIAGRNPLNTFLTGIGRADAVEAVGQRSGLY